MTPEELRIRPMNDDDLDRVMELERAIFASPWHRSFFQADMNHPAGCCLVAERGGIVVGYIVAWGTEEVHLANLAVAPEQRGQGIAGHLLDELLDFARAQQAESVYLEVRLSNTIAREFYARRGFVPVYMRRGYYENGEDAVVMEKELPD